MDRPRDLRQEPFRRFVILGESTVEGGGWLERTEDRFADVVARLINACQDEPVAYFNKGIGANAISPRSPGYAASRKPSALERYRTDVIDLAPDLFVLCYGLNDMRAAMPVEDFAKDMAIILRDVKAACNPFTVLTTVYYMTGWKSYPPFDRGSIALTEEYNAAIRDLARQYGCALADVWAGESGADWLIHPDGVHANTIGNLVIAHRVFEAIARHASSLTATTFAAGESTEWTRMTTAARVRDGDPFTKTW